LRNGLDFPKKPPTEDERRTEFLRLASVPGYNGVYVLGCFAGYVTIHAQQVRALNLIDSFAKRGVLSGRSQIAIIGGGIAGLTAAAAAAVRGVRRVIVFERESDLLVLQRNSEQRYVIRTSTIGQRPTLSMTTLGCLF
jgi:NADPH-dependent 2,4-dienoyl-CoA reductase/sulfur reductase-like enzyme